MSDSVPRERRRIGLRAPITGLVLVGLVVYGGYTGWERAFGDAETTTAASPDCEPTTTVTTTSAPVDPGGTPPAVTTPPAAPAGATTPVVPPATTAAPSTPGLVLLPEQVTVNVYNATERRGLAINTAAVLKDRGFTIDLIQNDPLEEVIAEPAKIRASSADAPEVRLLAQHVPGVVVVADGRASSTIDLVLGEGFSALGDPALVTPVPIASPRC